ncbi:MAG: NusG domain II-containing protein [Clostridia bacterium]|nr:NusG domain II-containing protein [Clostridia bacterium]
MPRKKDIWLILAVLLGALILFLLSQWLPKKSLNDRQAEVTIAPDAIEYLEEPAEKTVTAAPVQTRLPAENASPVPAAATETTEVPETTAEPDTAETAEPKTRAVPEETTAPAASAVQPDSTAEKTASGIQAGPLFGPVLNVSDEPVKGHVVIMVGGRQYGDPIPMDRDKIITIRQSADRINRIHISRDSVYMESSTCENQDCVGEGEITPENYRTRILSTYIVCLPNEVTVEFIPAEDTEAQK